MMQNRFQKIGVIKLKNDGYTGNRYGYNPHEMRDILRTRWEYSSEKGTVAEFYLGHKIDPLGYNKAMSNEKWVSGEYLLATPKLNIMSDASAFGYADSEEVTQLKEEIVKLQDKVKIVDTMDGRFETQQAENRALRDMVNRMEDEIQRLKTTFLKSDE